MVSYDLLLFMSLENETSNRGTNSMPFLIFRPDHLGCTSGIICGSGSFAVQFEDHFRSGDHLRSGIICGAVQIFFTLCKHLYFFGKCPRGKSRVLFNVKPLKSSTKQKKKLKTDFTRRKMTLDFQIRNLAISRRNG